MNSHNPILTGFISIFTFSLIITVGASLAACVTGLAVILFALALHGWFAIFSLGFLGVLLAGITAFVTLLWRDKAST